MVARALEGRHDAADTAALESISAIVSAACLAHDMGNPPFGHSGEEAICSFFSEGAGQQYREFLPESTWNDITHFDGNANTFRLLTHRFNGRRKGGFVMTYSTLASVVKYPFSAALAGNKPKMGFFTPERDTFLTIFDTLGIPALEHKGDRTSLCAPPAGVSR